MAYTVPADLLGLIVSGDLDGVTIYTDRFGKKVYYPKSPPKKPPSDLQVNQRDRFRLAQQDYMNLTTEQKNAFERLTQRPALCLTGQNLFIHVALEHDYDFLATLQRQWNISVPNPPAR